MNRICIGCLLTGAGLRRMQTSRRLIGPDSAPIQPCELLHHESDPHPTNAEDIGQRVLKLVESVRGQADIAPSRIEQLTGIKVEFNPDDANEYGLSGQLTKHWAYNLVSLPEGADHRPSRIMLPFDDESLSNADMAPICALHIDAYFAALQRAGFVSNAARGKHDRLLHWDFSRDEVSVQIYVRGESDAKAGHACASKLIINA